MPKQRVHREWFRPINRGLCDCGCNRRTRLKAGQDPTVYSWGEYVYGRWNTVQYVCEACFQRQVLPRLRAHAAPCGCTFELVAYHADLPPWLTMTPTCEAPHAA